MTCLAHITTSGVWLTTTTSGANYDEYIGQIAFTGTSSTQFMGVGSAERDCTARGYEMSLFQVSNPFLAAKQLVCQ